MRHPTKKHDGLRIKIRALDNCLDSGAVILGIYRHIPKSYSFKFQVDAMPEDRDLLLSRDEWAIL